MLTFFWLESHSTHCIVALTRWLGGGERDGEKVSLCSEDVVININGHLALLRKQQVQVFKHLCQKERVHPTQIFQNKDTEDTYYKKSVNNPLD